MAPPRPVPRLRVESWGTDFRARSNFGVGVAALFLLTPFALNNFYQGRLWLGLGSLLIVGVLAHNAWSIPRGRQIPWLTPAVLVPAIIVFLGMAYLRQGIIGALWSYPAILAFYFLLPQNQARLANVVALSVLLPLGWEVLAHPLAARVTATQLAVSIFSAIFLHLITDQQEKLKTLAVTDPLTGVFNRTLLDSSMERVTSQAHRSRTPMTLLAIDLDHFKSINDTHGHDAGDAVLQGVGEILRRRLRGSDLVFRLGGEEFLVLLYGTGPEDGRQVAEELRLTIAALDLVPDREVTASLGVATLSIHEGWLDWFKRADHNLYVAKSLGRNRVVQSIN